MVKQQKQLDLRLLESGQRIGVLRRMPDRAKRGRAVVRSNAQLCSTGNVKRHRPGSGWRTLSVPEQPVLSKCIGLEQAFASIEEAVEDFTNLIDIELFEVEQVQQCA